MEYFQERWITDLFLRQKRERSERSSKKVKDNEKDPKNSSKIPQTNPIPTTLKDLNSWPNIWNIGGTIPKFTNLQYSPATRKSHDSRFQKPINISLENFAIYVKRLLYV